MKKSILIISLFVLLTLAGLRAQEVASIEHDLVSGQYNSIVQVDADTYVLAYQGSGQDGFISTFTVSADGTSITEVTQLEHDTGTATYNSLCQVDSDTYALAYSGTGNDGYIKTFTISSDGTSITEVDELEHDTDHGEYNSIVKVDADTYVLAYTGPGEDGYIKTFTISSDGTSITEVASLEHDENRAKYNSIVQVDSDTYALAYMDNGYDGYITTFTISADGTSITEVASLEHDAIAGKHNSIIQVDSDTYVLAYSGNDKDGYIATFTISADGSTITEVDELEHDTDNGTYNSIVQVDADTYVLAYEGAGVDGFIKTFTISSDGTSITEVEELEHDTGNGEYNSIVQVDSDTYVLAYTGPGSDGYIATFTVASDGTLPVELTSFNVLSTRNDAIILQWVTESEINNLGFILDRRVPGTEWTEIATYITHPELQGQGSVTHQTIYSYTDNTVLSAETYDYRLADVDYDGNKVYHSMTVMGVSPNDVVPETFTLYPAYPNPFNPVTTIRFDIPEGAANLLSLRIFDINGGLVETLMEGQREPGIYTVQWNGSDQPSGVYFVKIGSGGFVQTKKMVLLK